MSSSSVGLNVMTHSSYVPESNDKRCEENPNLISIVTEKMFRPSHDFFEPSNSLQTENERLKMALRQVIEKNKKRENETKEQINNLKHDLEKERKKSDDVHNELAKAHIKEYQLEQRFVSLFSDNEKTQLAANDEQNVMLKKIERHYSEEIRKQQQIFKKQCKNLEEKADKETNELKQALENEYAANEKLKQHFEKRLENLQILNLNVNKACKELQEALKQEREKKQQLIQELNTRSAKEQLMWRRITTQNTEIIQLQLGLDKYKHENKKLQEKQKSDQVELDKYKLENEKLERNLRDRVSIIRDLNHRLWTEKTNSANHSTGRIELEISDTEPQVENIEERASASGSSTPNTPSPINRSSFFRWTNAKIKTLLELRAQNVPIDEIALRLGTNPSSCLSKLEQHQHVTDAKQ